MSENDNIVPGETQEVKPKRKYKKRPRGAKPRPVSVNSLEIQLRKKEHSLVVQRQMLKSALKLKKVTDDKEHGIVDGNDVFDSAVRRQLSKEKILWQPNPGPQTWFLEANEDEVLFSGGRASGKSMALIVDPLRWVTNKNFRAIVIRKTMPELRELISRAKDLYPQLVPGVKWREQEKMFSFPSGAKIEFGYCDTEDDVERYRGQEYTWIGFDELSQFPKEEIYTKICAAARTKDPTLKVYKRACLDQGEVLTTKGWVDIKDVKVDDYVYSLDNKGSSVVSRVYATASFDVEEPLVKVQKQNLFMSMTNDHRVVYSPLASKDYKLIRWNEYTHNAISIARAPLEYTGTGYKGDTLGMPSETYLAFLGIYLAEGCAVTKIHKGNYIVCVSQSKEPNRTKVAELLAKTGYNFSYCKNGDFKVACQSLHSALKVYGKAHDKFIPREILETATKEELKILFDWLVYGDGSYQTDTAITYVTVSEKLKDDMCELSVKLGYKTQVQKVISKNPNHRDRYNIFINLRKPLTRIEKNRGDVTLEDYKGKVYCISVEGTENFIVRQRGYVWVSGNTTNPSGVGRMWCKRRFIDKGAPNTRIPIPTKVYVQGKEIEVVTTRKWISSTIQDNPVFLENNMGYMADLANLSGVLSKQWLNDDWSAAEGQAFPDFNPAHHVVKPFDIPRNWMRFRACDWGFSTMACCLWFAVDYDGMLYVYRELKTQYMTADVFARKVVELEAGEHIRYGVIDGSVGDRRGSSEPTIDEQMRAQGCIWRYADKSRNSRIAGKNIMHQLLRVDAETNKPRIQIFENCKELIDELGALPLDKSNAEDVDTDAVDHAWDACRYGILSRPGLASLWDTWERSRTESTEYQPENPYFL